MVISKLLDGISAPAASSVLYSQNFNAMEYGIAQVEITGTATVVVEGRVSPDFPWTTVDTLAASGATRVSLFPEMRFNATAVAAGTVTAALVA